MAPRLGLVILLVAFAAVLAAANAGSPWEAFGFPSFSPTTSTKLGDLDMGSDSDSGRRSLAGEKKPLSYEAMRQGSIPCSKRGASYYTCSDKGQGNPYARETTKITKSSLTF